MPLIWYVLQNYHPSHHVPFFFKRLGRKSLNLSGFYDDLLLCAFFCELIWFCCCFFIWTYRTKFVLTVTTWELIGIKPKATLNNNVYVYNWLLWIQWYRGKGNFCFLAKKDEGHYFLKQKQNPTNKQRSIPIKILQL